MFDERNGGIAINVIQTFVWAGWNASVPDGRKVLDDPAGMGRPVWVGCRWQGVRTTRCRVGKSFERIRPAFAPEIRLCSSGFVLVIGGV